MTIIWASHELFQHLQMRKTDSTRCKGHWVTLRLDYGKWACQRSSNEDWERRQHGEKLRMEA